jgi:hypothetical protein
LKPIRVAVAVTSRFAEAIYMDAEQLLSQIVIPTPCPMDWNLMEGNDRVRFCGQCHKSVYNLSTMTSQEAADLIREQYGELCGRLYQRPDGSIVTADCALTETRPRRFQFHLRSIMATIAAVATVLGLTKLLVADESGAPPKPVLPALPKRGIFMGKMVPRHLLNTPGQKTNVHLD